MSGHGVSIAAGRSAAGGDRFEILNQLGSGGMGVVLSAFDRQTRRTVALKFARPGACAGIAHQRRLAIEARAMRLSSGARVCQVMGMTRHDGAPCLAMEALHGRTLEDILRRGRVSVLQAVALAWQLAQALESVHGAGLVHQDVKPANMIVTAEGDLKLLDFGLAVPAGHTPVPLEVVGSVHYLSPDRVRGLKTDVRSDLFSLGSVLYELLTGERAFAGQSAFDVLVRLLDDEPPQLRQLEDCPRALSTLVIRLLAKQPHARPSSATAVRRALASVMRDLRRDEQRWRDGGRRERGRQRRWLQ